VTKSKERGERQDESRFLVDVAEEDVFQKVRNRGTPRWGDANQSISEAEIYGAQSAGSDELHRACHKWWRSSSL
jgi:hypothetical protein